MAVVDMDTERTADAIEQMVDFDNLQGLLVAGLSASGGILFAQTVADRVLPFLNINPNPSSLVGAVGSAGVKGVVAVAAGTAAAQASGLPQVVAAFIAVGALTAASTDVLEQFLSLPQLAGRRRTLAAGTPGTRSRATANQTSGGSVRKVSSRSATRGTSPSTTAQMDGGMNEDEMMEAEQIRRVDSDNDAQEFRQVEDTVEFRSGVSA